MTEPTNPSDHLDAKVAAEDEGGAVVELLGHVDVERPAAFLEDLRGIVEEHQTESTHGATS